MNHITYIFMKDNSLCILNLNYNFQWINLKKKPKKLMSISKIT